MSDVRCQKCRFSLKPPLAVSAAAAVRHARWVLALAIGVLGAAPLAAAPQVSASELPEPVKRPVQYLSEVHPILAEHCVACHGPDKQKSGLRLDSREAALAGGSSYGPAIVPGKSAESPLVLFTAHQEPGLEMPPDDNALPAQSIAVLRAWIDQGAKWPASHAAANARGTTVLGNQELIFKQAASHWAFQPIRRAEAPMLDRGSATIDRLVAEKLTAKGLQRSARADARTLLRRLHFDLTGLPPAMETVDRFSAEFARDADGALEAKVDELLASPHFGERWGRYWLDLARYADTQDFFPAPADLRYPYAWTYRDYVVRAFNDDKPYDQFIREQLAADQLGLAERDPALAALGYLTVGPRFLRRADEIINDRIDVVTRGLMGMTVVCARCHDHKYDPIPTADFYSLHGVFNSTEDLVDLPEIEPVAPIAPKDRADYESAKRKAQQALADFLTGQKAKAVADLLARPEAYFDGLVQMELKKIDVRTLIGAGKLEEVPLRLLGSRWKSSKTAGKWADDPVFGLLALAAKTPPARISAALAQAASSGRLPAKGPAIDPDLLLALRREKPVDHPALLKLYGRLLAQGSRSSKADAARPAKAFTAAGGWFDFTLDDVREAYRARAAGRRELDKLEGAVTELEARHPGAPPRAMAVKDKARPSSPVIFIRGERSRPGESVPRRFLKVLDPQQPPFASDRSGRLDLAEKIASAQNPLTPRVWANHVWRHLLGRPLVKTPGDFGLQAEPPSHPELLDWLASALIERDWSTKRLIRDIVLSATYQQASADRPEADKIDADNVLLWRANRRRMDFEAMRDAMLATSGELDPALGGRSVNLSTEPFSARRTIYGFVDRANLDPLFATFDFPHPDIASPQRAQTLVPQQALFALNDGFIISQAQALASQAVTKAGTQSVVDWLYRRVYQRHATRRELAIAEKFLEQTATLDDRDAPQGQWLYGVGSAEPEVPRDQAFTPLGYFNSQARRYQGGRVFPHPQHGFASLIASGGHPGDGIGRAAIRRWIAPYRGEFSIEGELSVVRQNKGDGVRIRLISSKAGLVREWIADHATVKTNIERVTIEAGEVLDFAVDCRESTNSDGFRWPLTIKLLVRPEDAPGDVQSLWDAAADFKPPPPPRLDPLEQLAHTLLITNEFLFID